MWQRFTEHARSVVFFAQEEAGRLGENFVNTEHLLLGILKQPESTAARILQKLTISTAELRAQIEQQIQHKDREIGPKMQLAARAKRIIDLAYDEARNLGNNNIGSEHILLGLIREDGGMAHKVLRQLGASLEEARAEVRKMQGVPQPSPPKESSPEELLQRIGQLILSIDPTLRDAPLETLRAALFGEQIKATEESSSASQ